MRILLYILIFLLIPVSIVVQGCGEWTPERGLRVSNRAGIMRLPSKVFGFVRGDSAVTTRHYEAADLGTWDTVLIFQTDGTDLVIVEHCDGERQTLHEKWLNPLGYERRDCEVKP